MKTKRGAGAWPFGCRPIARRIERNDEALEAAPRIAHAEVFETVEKCSESFFRHRLQHDREEARRAREVPLPDGVSWMVRKRGMQHAVDFRPIREPPCDGNAGLLMALEAHVERPQASEAEVGLFRSGASAESFLGVVDQSRGAGVSCNSAEHRIGVTDDVFRCRLDRHVGAERQRLAIERRRPCVVGDDPDFLRMGCRCNRRNVLHFESLRAGALDHDEARVGLEVLGDARADRRIIIGRLDAEPLQHSVCERARRLIDAVDDQNVIARLGECENGRRYRAESGRREDRGCTAFKVHNRVFKGARRRRCAPPVGVGLLASFERF